MNLTQSHTYLLFQLFFVLFFPSTISAAGGNFYSSPDSPVLELTSQNFKKEILDSNSVSVVEFYAPWCGHCQRLKPEYTKAAKSLNGLATVAAVNCDEQINQSICGKYKIQGFPTIKVFRPHKVDLSENNKRDLNKKNIRTKPAVEDYNRERDAKSIVNFAISRLRNYVLAIKSSNIEKFLTNPNAVNKPKVIVLAPVKSKHSGSGSIPPLLKSLSSDFVYKYSFGYIDHNQPDILWEKFGLTKDSKDDQSKLIIIPPSRDNDSATPPSPIIYNGQLKKAPISDFLFNYIKELRLAEKEQKKKTGSSSYNEKIDL